MRSKETPNTPAHACPCSICHNQKLNEFYSSSATGSPRASRQQICNLNNLTSLQEAYQPTNHLMSCCCHPCPKNGITRCYNHLQPLFCTFMRFWHVQAQAFLPLATTTAWSRVWRVASDTQAVSWCIELMNIPLGWPTGHRTFAVSSLARLLKTSKATVQYHILSCHNLALWKIRTTLDNSYGWISPYINRSKTCASAAAAHVVVQGSAPAQANIWWCAGQSMIPSKGAGPWMHGMNQNDSNIFKCTQMHRIALIHHDISWLADRRELTLLVCLLGIFFGNLQASCLPWFCQGSIEKLILWLIEFDVCVCEWGKSHFISCRGFRLLGPKKSAEAVWAKTRNIDLAWFSHSHGDIKIHSVWSSFGRTF